MSTETQLAAYFNAMFKAVKDSTGHKEQHANPLIAHFPAKGLELTPPPLAQAQPRSQKSRQNSGSMPTP